MKLISALAATMTASVLTVAALASQARAAQHQNANLRQLELPGLSVDQELLVDRKGRVGYWAMVWKWSDDPATGGYVGLQTNGNRSNGSNQRHGVLQPLALHRRHRAGLDYWIWPGRAAGLGSSLSDLLGRLPARSPSARLSDGAGPG